MRISDWSSDVCSSDLDGRGFSLQGYEEGYFLGPTLFDHVTPAMRTYQEEIFGPVLQIVRATTLPEAVELASAHQYGNGVAIFTRNGHAAREFASAVEVGMVGVRSEEHTSELQSLMRISYAVFCLKKKKMS